jgi:hypothetical protein
MTTLTCGLLVLSPVNRLLQAFGSEMIIIPPQEAVVPKLPNYGETICVRLSDKKQ